MFPLNGTSGAQDPRRRAALQYLSEINGGQAPSGPTPPGTGSGQASADVAALLQQATDLTLKQPDQIAQNQAAWRSALLFLRENMPDIGQPQGGPAPVSPMAMGAQAGVPTMGRPPR